MRGTRQFAEIGDMSATMRNIAESQDKIGWRRFTEGCISKQFQTRQPFFLQMTNNRLNGTDWTKQLISRILQITHSQWIYRNILLHDKSKGYLRNKTAEELAENIHRLAELQPEDVPTESKFLLEIDSGKLIKEHVETQAYWVIAVKAARKAKAAHSARSYFILVIVVVAATLLVFMVVVAATLLVFGIEVCTLSIPEAYGPLIPR